MDKPQSVTVETFELTEIVEEGLPLDEIPEVPVAEGVGVFPEVDSGKMDTVILEPERESVAVLEFDDFGDTQDDFDSGFEEPVGSISDFIVEDDADVLVLGTDNEVGEASLELDAGYIDALLGGDELAAVEITERPEFHDPVLVELKNAGLKQESDTVSTIKDGLSEDSEPKVEADIELPEDYLTYEEMSDIEVESEPAAPEVCAEPISPDFSRQIESMTQEWSKQLLQTTYTSMDKMIKAIGDLAPTIVDQVAREVIPPLAEKVIKAEIARLEEKLASEGEREEISDS